MPHSSTRWPDEVEGAGWDYGTNLDDLKELTDYWQHTFDWRAQEAKLNQFAQFKTDIDGHSIHFMYEHGKGPNPILQTEQMGDRRLPGLELLDRLVHRLYSGDQNQDASVF